MIRIFPPIGPLFDGKFHPLEPISTAAKSLNALAGEADTSTQAVGFPSREMSHLTQGERECLAHIGGLASATPRSCDDEILRRLQALGLIAENVKVMVPLPLFRRSFHLTVAGRAALDEDE